MWYDDSESTSQRMCLILIGRCDEYRAILVVVITSTTVS